MGQLLATLAVAPAWGVMPLGGSMDLKDILQLAAVLVALVSLFWQQRRLANEEVKKEKRIETKLKIFYILTNAERDLSESEIMDALERTSPLNETDKTEARKSIYEMLKDETIRFTRSKKYKPRRRSESDEA